MPNPWVNLPETAPYVLQEDRQAIDNFNNRPSLKEHHRIDTHLIPEPFVGPLDANVVILLLNPGIDANTHRAHSNPAFKNHLIQSIKSPDTHPSHIHIGNAIAPNADNWWYKNTRQLIQDLGENGSTILRENMLAVEFSPYHSPNYAHAHLRLRSQEYSFELVREAMRRDAAIILTRGEKLWKGAVHELISYSHFFKLSSHRRAAITQNNLGAHAYQILIEKLKHRKR